MPHDHNTQTDCGLTGCGCGATQSTGPRPDVARIPAPWRPKQRVRAVSIAVFRRSDQILAGPVYDDEGQIKGWRPLGGEIEFGETASAALIREMHEETGQEIQDLRQIGVLENLYDHHGETGHEIVFVLAARFENPLVYEADQLAFAEADGVELHAKWISLAKARAGRTQLFPAGLAHLLT